MLTVDFSEVERQVESFMLALGISPPSDGIRIDGKIHRWGVESDKGGAKSGAYLIHPDGVPAGWVQDFHLGEPVKWKFDAQRLDSNTRNTWRKYAESPEVKAKRAEEDRRIQEEKREALACARAVYEAARSIEEAADHPYLLAKRVQPRGGLRVGDMPSLKGGPLRDILFIPCVDVMTGELAALHRVFPWRDKETGKFPKVWFRGTCGGVFVIDGDVPRGPVFVAEGVATALSMYDVWIEEGEPEEPGDCVSQCTVLGCMSSGNLIKQARAIRARYKDRPVLVVKDDDEAGEKAARAALDAGFDGVIDIPDKDA
jgi:putative DNA primase/helicase